MEKTVFTNSDISRFWQKVQIGAPSECWPWRASTGRPGYGHMWLTVGARRCFDAHKLAWMMTYGEVPEGFVIRHRCNQKRCCNPLHLEIGTYSENTADALRDGIAGQKLRAEDVRAILRDRHAGHLRIEIAARYGVRETYVSAILTGHRWHAVTGIAPPAPRQRDEDFMLSFDF